MVRQGLTNRLATNIQRKHAQVSREQLQKYFKNVEQELKDVPASNIWNYDETNLRDNPGARKYVMKRGTKYAEKVMDSGKVAFSVMFAGNAEGDVLLPHVVYKSAHLYNQWFFKLMLPKLHHQEGKKF